MIYLDNAATTYPKPPCVQAAIYRALREFGANPGRGGHAMSMATTTELYRVRETAAAFFGLSDPTRVIFTSNCTTALNIVIKGLLRGGGRAVVSCLEHNAVMRPLQALSPSAPCYDIASVYPEDDDSTVRSFEQQIRPETRAIICTHASNVFGFRLPVDKLAAMAHRHHLPLVVDAAQSAGIIPLSIEAEELDYVCVAGHKCLYGPMGTGLLLINNTRRLPSLLEGGTGSSSAELNQPEDLPDRFESGTPNVSGLIGLRAGLDFVKAQDILSIAAHEIQLTQLAYDMLSALPHITVYGTRPQPERHVPVMSFTVEGQHSEDTAALLAQHDIAVRAGLHCAPTAHRSMNTLTSGTVRIAPGIRTTPQDIRRLCAILRLP